jgi:hypothetical protein
VLPVHESGARKYLIVLLLLLGFVTDRLRVLEGTLLIDVEQLVADELQVHSL